MPIETYIPTDPLEWAKLTFTDAIENLIDDPNDLLHPDQEYTPAQIIASYRKLAENLHLDFDTVVMEVGKSQHTLDRLRRLEETGRL